MAHRQGAVFLGVWACAGMLALPGCAALAAWLHEIRTVHVDVVRDGASDAMGKTTEEVRRERAEWIEPRIREVAEPVLGITLGRELGLDGKHESIRRRIREAVRFGRDHMGLKFCSDGHGYWLARSAAEWAEFKAAENAKTVFRFVRMARVNRAVAERQNGQGLLFDLPREWDR